MAVLLNRIRSRLKILVTCHSKIRSSLYKGLLSCLIALGTPLSNTIAQEEFLAVSSSFDHSAREWQMFYYDFSADIEQRATMYLKWPFKNDWTEWSIDIGDEIFNIKQRYRMAALQFELISAERTVSIRQKWLGDNNEWLISFDKTSLKWQTDTPNNLELWYMEDGEEYLDMWTSYPGDSRDWIIEDRFNALPKEVKLAAVFITIYLTTPKY